MNQPPVAGVMAVERFPMLDDDDQLMERIRRRDEEAFDLLAAKHHDLLHRHVVRIVKDDDTTADLLQEVFLRAWTRAEQWDGRGSVKAWLYRIATNLALNHLRTVRRRGETPLMPEPTGAEDDDPPQTPSWMVDSAAAAPDESAIRLERARRISGMVDELPDEKREVWNLVYEQDLDHASAAEQLGIPPGTVKSRLYHARQQLAREWAEWVKEWENSE